MKKTIGILLVLLSGVFGVFAQVQDEPVSLNSWCKGLGRIEETKIISVVSHDKPASVSEMRTESGKVFELQMNYRPKEYLKRDHWIVQLFKKEEFLKINKVKADCFDVEMPGTGGDHIGGEGIIRYLYPEDARAIRFNHDKLITEGRVLFFDPLKRPRVFKFEEFKIKMNVRSVEMAPDDPTKVLSMEIEVEAINYRKCERLANRGVVEDGGRCIRR